MSSTLIKSYAVNYGKQDEKKSKRVIDSNEAVSAKIKALEELLDAPTQEELEEGFSEGLDAAQVDALLTDQEELEEEKARNEAAQKIVEEADEQAHQIIEDANDVAAKIIEEANAKAQTIQEEARQQGLAEGNEKGYAEGLERVADKEREAEEKAEAYRTEFEEKMSELEPQLVEKLTGIYSHVFGIDLTGRSDVVLHLLKDTIRNIDSVKNYLVHVSKEDHELVLANRDELAAGLGATVTVEIIEDVTLSAGNCFIETDGGIFDCSIGTELDLLAKELKILSYSQ